MSFLYWIKEVFKKNNKFVYYFKSYTRLLIPRFFCRILFDWKFKDVEQFDKNYMLYRVNYYNKLNKKSDLGSGALQLKDFRYGIKPKVYFFDGYEFFRFFPSYLKIQFLFGDVTHVPEVPSFVKSRPIQGHNENSVLLKFNKIRHFLFIHDDTPFACKTNMVVWRGKVYQKNREIFLEKYYEHPLFNIGKVNNDRNNFWMAPRMSIIEQLNYKFIMCLEGNDVASNLKWVMSSNSIAVMPRPRYETWFMEGSLIGGVHFIEIKDDYSDLEYKINYYINHTSEAEKILENAHAHVLQFKNKKREELISLLTILKYFKNTGQPTQISAGFFNSNPQIESL